MYRFILEEMIRQHLTGLTDTNSVFGLVHNNCRFSFLAIASGCHCFNHFVTMGSTQDVNIMCLSFYDLRWVTFFPIFNLAENACFGHFSCLASLYPQPLFCIPKGGQKALSWKHGTIYTLEMCKLPCQRWVLLQEHTFLEILRLGCFILG